MSCCLELELAMPEKRFVPDLLTESMVKPPARSKSTARAAPRIAVTCAMSCDAGSDGERAEQRQRHVDAVELVDVVLAAAAGARAADRVLAELDGRNQLEQVAILLPDRHAADLLGGDGVLRVAELAIDQAGRGRHFTASVTPPTPRVASTMVSAPSWTCAWRVTGCIPDRSKFSV